MGKMQLVFYGGLYESFPIVIKCSIIDSIYLGIEKKSFQERRQRKNSFVNYAQIDFI